ncbi:outer membrane receptor protein involved in Fe transport [Flavobacterium endophyticum]|uniref:Outer membrane receptor protein involved in Fe transport n=1 Tax=Flavobacterium endophyticum TaxID=1540163 RepID=A0A495LXZ6_9FLAO|nr:TonB-dependent receptor [Flavobacterium endophyticum]RKS18471.1 outer membrane receptor protein involved in Fe transport [Flavobacterium endophyticum]
MKKIVFITILLSFATIYSQEIQKSITVSGKVIEKKTATAIEFATITLINSSDGKVIVETITDGKGTYSLKITPGKYNIKAEFIGLESSTLENFDLQNNQVLPPFLLEEMPTQLETIEIQTEKTTIEHKLDKKVFNVGSDLVSKGGNAIDILNNVPSVSVNYNGAVSLRGNTGVRILINGKPSVLTANNGLEQIPAENIEKVEVITNPSSKYDSEGTAGIINIILKKNKSKGFGSSVQATAGIPDNYALGYNVNYKNKKINIFSDLRYRYINFLGKESSSRTIYDDNVIDSYLNGTVDRDRTNRTFTTYFGGDYYFNDKNMITLSYFYRNNTSRSTVDYAFNYLDENRNPERISNAKEAYKEPQTANQIELNYIKTFAKEGQKFTINLQYDFWNDDENESIVEQEIFPVSLPFRALKSRNIESSKDFLFQSDYSLPFNEKSKIEFGIKGEIRRINSDYQAYDNNVAIDSLNNLLHYDERIIGAYVQYGSSIKKLNYLLGLRIEDSNTGSNDRINQFNIDKKYTDFFPTAHFTYEFNDIFNVQLSYSRRISRPEFWQLNPFGGIADRRNIRIGNPDLDPVYTNSYELGTLIKWRKFIINPSLYHQFSRNIFEDIRITNTDGFLVEQAINSGTESRIGAEISISYSPLKWLTLNGEMNYYTFEQKGIFNVSDKNFTSKQSTRIKFSTWNFQTNLNYLGATSSGQYNSKSQYWFDLGMGKDIWNERATITLKADNIFDSRISKGLVRGNDYTLDYNFRSVGPRVYATFTYRLNRKKSDRDRLPE